MPVTYRGSYSPSARRRWWQRFPGPVERAALRLWGRLPRPLRAGLAPLGRLFGPHTVTAPVVPLPGEGMPEVAEARRDGFDLLARYTGAEQVVEVWPEEHRRSVPVPDGGAPDREEPVWLVRSPWPSIGLDEVFPLLWRWVERDRESLDEAVWRARAAEALGWDEERAREWRD